MRGMEYADREFTIGPVSAGLHDVTIVAEGFAEHRIARRDVQAHETWDLGTVRVVVGGRVQRLSACRNGQSRTLP